MNSLVSCDKYPGTDFILTYSSIANITDEVVKAKDVRLLKYTPLGHVSMYLITRQIYISKDYTGMIISLIVHSILGFKHGSSIFHRLSDTIPFVLKQGSHNTIIAIIP